MILVRVSCSWPHKISEEVQLQTSQGEEIFFKYADGSNKYLFLLYGFTIEQLQKNQFDFEVCLNNTDALYRLKRERWVKMRPQHCVMLRLVHERG
jgi:hypothetical protein